jgi:hypothetical protein
MPIENTKDESQVTAALSGCLYALFVIALSGCMLLVNSLLCLTIYAALPKFDNQELSSRLGQLFFFVTPIALLIVEWDLLDRVQRLFTED